MPSVVIKERIPNFATITPFTQPTIRPATTAAKKQTGIGTPWIDKSAATTPPRLTMFPMERSNSLTVITKVAPSATIARGAAWRVILRKFFSVKNDAGLRSPKIPMMTTNAATVP